MEQYGPGAAWRTADRPVKTAYMNNTADGILSCTLYLTSFSSTLVGLGNYPAGRLLVTQTTDEEGHITYTFTDNQGQTVLIREMNGSVTNDTYYVYDDLGQLRYVLPPMCDNINEATLDNYAYKYQYDERGNCILIKLPGCDPVTMKYDKADRLIFCQDGNQAGSKWTFFFYDAFGRQTVTGIWNSNSIPALDNLVVKTDYTGTGTLTGYTVNLTLPAVVLMTVNYYDDYSFVNTLTASENAKMPYVSVSGYDAQYTGGAKGLLTGNRTYQVGDTTKYVVSALYYDHHGRVVQSHASNHLGGFEDEYFAYTFTGKVKTRQHVHSIPGNTGTEIYNYTYDHAERLLAVTHQINSSPAVTLATNTYDEVGRLLTKTRAGEQSTYLYNVRSWLTQITGTKFNQTLTYNTAVNNVSPPYSAYNGNISAMKWKAGTETVERGYKFEYDALNRLTAATYGEGTSLTTNSNRYDEKVTLYDKMGNIKNLERRGKADNDVFGVIDNLTYAYAGNKLTKVTDSATLAGTYYGAFQFTDGANTDTEYTYDANGNLKKDYNKRIVDIQYNSLNLPNGLQFTNGNTTNYVYDASGQKLSVTHLTAVAGVVIPMTNVMTPLAPAQISSTFKTDYCGNVIYENGAVSKILTDEGYITFTGATPVYHYYLKDHQGNNRVVINQAGTVEQVTHYYPFGGLMGESTSGGVQPYKYNGKELDRVHGLDLFDYGKRHYDAVLGRWHSVDPLANKHPQLTPYAYCANNPLKYIDPDGRDVKPAGTAELVMIQNTLPKDARNYVRLDKNGLIDRKLLNSYDGKSLNFNNLKTMVNSDRMVEVVLDDKFTFMGQDGKLGTATMSHNEFDPKYDSESDKDLTGETMGGLSTGESGFMGKTLFPDKDGIQNSPNNNIIVVVNKNLSPAGAAETYSHEANGHALLYIKNGGNHKGASHQPVNGRWVEGNNTLMEMIINSKKETIKNMQKR